MLFKVLTLICASSVSAPDCQRDTAISVITAPEPVSMQQCLFQGQSRIAAGALAPDEGTYAKVVCRPYTPAEAAR